MPFSLKTTGDGLGVVISGHGDITDDQYVNMVEALLEEARNKQGNRLYYLCDYTDVKTNDISRDILLKNSQLTIDVAALEADLMVAIVARQELAFGLSRIWESLANIAGWDTAVFPKREDAEYWIQTRALNRYGIGNLVFK